jgi:ankyrin repeat protein
MGNREIAEFLLEQGAPNNICTAAMLGQEDEVQAMLEADPSLANARGAHGITVMYHAAISGDTYIADLLKGYGCREGYSQALHAAVKFEQEKMVRWLLVNMANPLDFNQKTPLQIALEKGNAQIADLLREHGGVETWERTVKVE